jgi:hypothetical protein
MSPCGLPRGGVGTESHAQSKVALGYRPPLLRGIRYSTDLNYMREIIFGPVAAPGQRWMLAVLDALDMLGLLNTPDINSVPASDT